MEEQNMDKPVTVKLRKSSSVKDTLARIKQIPDVVWIEPVFPDEADPVLSRFCVAQVKSSAVEQVLLNLRQDPDVELAYESPVRKL